MDLNVPIYQLLKVDILAVVTEDLPISLRFSPAIFLIAKQVHHPYTSSTNNGGILITHVLALSDTDNAETRGFVFAAFDPT